MLLRQRGVPCGQEIPWARDNGTDGRQEGQSGQPLRSSASVHHTSRIQHEDKRWRSGRGGRPTAALVEPADVRGLKRRFDPSNPCKASRSNGEPPPKGGTPLNPDIYALRSQSARRTGLGVEGRRSVLESSAVKHWTRSGPTLLACVRWPNHRVLTSAARNAFKGFEAIKTYYIRFLRCHTAGLPYIYFVRRLYGG